MKGFLGITLLTFFLVGLGLFIEKHRDPYEEGSHFDYYIFCNDGYKYKIVNKVSIPCKNSDGTDLKCNEKRH